MTAVGRNVRVKWLSLAHTDRNVWFRGVVLGVYPPKEGPATLFNQLCPVDDGSGLKPRCVPLYRLMID